MGLGGWWTSRDTSRQHQLRKDANLGGTVLDLFTPTGMFIGVNLPWVCSGLSDFGQTLQGQLLRSRDSLHQGGLLMGCEGDFLFRLQNDTSFPKCVGTFRSSALPFHIPISFSRSCLIYKKSILYPRMLNTILSGFRIWHSKTHRFAIMIIWIKRSILLVPEGHSEPPLSPIRDKGRSYSFHTKSALPGPGG